MLATAELWRFLDEIRAFPRWRLSSLHVALPRLRLEAGRTRFAITAMISFFDETPGGPSLVSGVTVSPERSATRSATPLWRSAYLRHLREQLGEPRLVTIQGRREAHFFRRVLRLAPAKLRAEIDRVSAAISPAPSDPRLSMLAALPLQWRLDSLSIGRQERLRGDARIDASVGAGVVTLCASPSATLERTAWGRQTLAALTRAGYRNPGNPTIIVLQKVPGGIREVARIDAVIERALRAFRDARAPRSRPRAPARRPRSA